MPNVSGQWILRDAVLGFMRIHVLHHCAEGPVYGIDMIEELRRHGYRVSPGTLYPMLHAMEEAGFLRSTRKVVAGKSRRYYHATKRGETLLVELRARLRELVGEVLEIAPLRPGTRSLRRPRS